MSSAEFEGLNLYRWKRPAFEEISAKLHGQHLELVEADVIDKQGESPAHVASHGLLHQWLTGVFGTQRVRRSVRIDVAPEDNPRNEPEPDLIVLNRDFTEIAGNPGPADILLLIEIADESVRAFDFSCKGPVYARAAIPEFWLLDLAGRRMVASREPREGKYNSILVCGAEESLAPLAAPQAILRVFDTFAL